MEARDRMLFLIRKEARLTGPETGRYQLSDRVMAAMGSVPREEFVPQDLIPWAYENEPLPIGSGQTISQPFIVALMIDFLDPEPEHRVLEVGTGCGYQAAVLSRLVQAVYSVEYLPELGNSAAERLRHLGYTNIQVRIGDGRSGWPEEAPFDGIVVTAGAPGLPPALVEQLAPGGRLVIPVGRGLLGQDLRLITKDRRGKTRSRSLLSVTFVPLEGG